MASSDLVEEIKDLASKLRPVFDADKSRIQGEGRVFDSLRWVQGQPDSGKYPAGPAYLPMGVKPTVWKCLMLMNAQDVAATALGGAFFYGLGFANAKRLGVQSAHRLGFWVAVPGMVLGLLGGLNKGAYRYYGLMPNGNAALYPGYTDSSAPMFLKHSTSDRRAVIAPGVRMDPSRQMERGQ